ncbi:MAG: hypothetical protein ACYCO9_18465 [Streptosporangiaceae bacterium]
MFLKAVAVTAAVVRSGGQVRAEGRPDDHAAPGPVEDWLDAQAGPGVIDGAAERSWTAGTSSADLLRPPADQRRPA